MPTLPTLNGPCDVLGKLERERIRVLKGPDDDDVLDGFVNFCVTAWSMSDYLVAACKFDEPAKKAAYARWLDDPLIASARDIANRSKHFSLRKQASTKTLVVARRGVVDILEDPEGTLHAVTRHDAPVLEVVLDDGTRFDMWRFLHGVIVSWAKELKGLGIVCP